MTSNRNKRLLTICLVGAFAVLGTATADGDGEGSSEDGSEIVDNIAKVAELESELDSDEPHAVGPGANVIAAAIASRLEDDDAVAVQVIPGSPRAILVVLELPGFDLLEAEDRRDELLGVHDLFDAPDARVGIGVKDGLFYKSVLTRNPSQWPPTFDTNPSDARGTLAALFETPEAPVAAAQPLRPAAAAGPFVVAASCNLISEFSKCAEYDQGWLSAVDREVGEASIEQGECTDIGGVWTAGPCPSDDARPERCEVEFQGGRTVVRYYAESAGTWENPADECGYRARAGFGTSELMTP